MEARASERADAIYRTGPETVTLQATSIAIGRVTGLSREDDAPPARGAMVVRWTARGTLTNVQMEKGGTGTGDIPIERCEQSPVVSGGRGEPGWTQAYGDLIDGGSAVAFAGPDPLIVPSGTGETDLIALVKKTLGIAALKDQPARNEAILAWLSTGSTDAERRAALRLALHSKISWASLRPAIEAAWPASAPGLRQFFSGAAGFAISEGIWPEDDARPVEFMCAAFGQAEDRASVGHMLQLKHLLIWTERSNVDARTALRSAIKACLQERKSAGRIGPELKPFFDQMELSVTLP